MMALFWRTKNFKNTYKEWNRKLQLSGFKDIEAELKGDRVLRQRATNCYRQATQLERESRLEYFCFVGHLVHTTIFESELEKDVMFKHSEGLTIKEIVDDIKHKGISRDRKTIRYIIRRWQMKWGIRTWNLKQMNLKKSQITK